MQVNESRWCYLPLIFLNLHVLQSGGNFLEASIQSILFVKFGKFVNMRKANTLWLGISHILRSTFLGPLYPHPPSM